MIGLHEYADGVAAEASVDFPRRGAGAALEPIAAHARAAADVSFGHASRARLLDRRDDVFRLYMEAVDVVEKSVVRFRDDRQRPGLKQLDVLGRPPDRGIAHDADAVRVRDE